MGLREDFEKEKKAGATEETYLRLIWDETELVGDHFIALDLEDLYVDTDAVAEILKEFIKSAGPSSERQAFYRKRCDRCLGDDGESKEFKTFSDELCNWNASEKEIRDHLARFFMRVMRGETSTDDTHRSIKDANAVLGQGQTKPWRMRLESLFQCDSK